MKSHRILPLLYSRLKVPNRLASPSYYNNHSYSSAVSEGTEAAESNEPLLVVEECVSVTLIGLNRPSKRNALNEALITSLRQALSNFEADENSNVAVLYGVGGNFCAGLDLQDISTSPPKSLSLPLIDEPCSKPIVASVSGYAVGEGFNLAMACDMRVLEEKSVLGLFNRRFGMPLSPAAVARISACVGLSYAMELILTGRAIPGEEAVQKGLANLVTACGAGRGQALTIAQSLTKFPQAGLRADRASLYQTLQLPTQMMETFDQERLKNLEESQKELRYNAGRFLEGVGKHGTFKNLVIKDDHPHWMK